MRDAYFAWEIIRVDIVTSSLASVYHKPPTSFVERNAPVRRITLQNRKQLTNHLTVTMVTLTLVHVSVCLPLWVCVSDKQFSIELYKNGYARA